MFECCECYVLSGGGLCDGFITRPEDSYRLWRVVVCDQETSKMRRLKPVTGLWKIQPKGLQRQEKKQINMITYSYVSVTEIMAMCREEVQIVQVQ